MSLLVRKPGILTTVQDLGRTGSRSLGINPNGVMDTAATRLINTILVNKEDEAVLEMHFPAGEFEFETDCSFAVGGADFGAQLNGVDVQNWGSANAAKGDILKFVKPNSGNRCYVSVSGGFAIDEWLGSKSTSLAARAGGFHGRRLESGDHLEFAAPRITAPRKIGPSLIPHYSRFPTVRITASAEFGLLTAISERALLSGGFTLTKDSNRMGFRLLGEPLHLLHKKEMVSAAVTFGTIQLLPDGQMIVLMADHQTSGGYPRIANVISTDLPIVAQLGPGDTVGFHLVSIDDAERLAKRFEEELCLLELGVRFTKT